VDTITIKAVFGGYGDHGYTEQVVSAVVAANADEYTRFAAARSAAGRLMREPQLLRVLADEPREIASTTVTGSGEVTTSTRPGLSVAKEVNAAALSAILAGVDPRRAGLDAQVMVLDRLLSQVRGGK
jgi:hypothetical protein